MIRRPDHCPCVHVHTCTSRSWLFQFVADALRKASLPARIHRARNGSSVTQRHKRQAVEYAGGGHHPYRRIRLGQVQHLRPDVSSAAPPRPAFVWTVVPQGRNHVHSMSPSWSVRTSPPWSVRTQGACCSTGEIGAPCDEHNRGTLCRTPTMPHSALQSCH